MKRFLFTISLFVLPVLIMAQYKVSGVVIDEKTQQPLAGGVCFLPEHNYQDTYKQ
jgi:hypothetical protein